MISTGVAVVFFGLPFVESLWAWVSSDPLIPTIAKALGDSWSPQMEWLTVRRTVRFLPIPVALVMFGLVLRELRKQNSSKHRKPQLGGDVMPTPPGPPPVQPAVLRRRAAIPELSVARVALEQRPATSAPKPTSPYRSWAQKDDYIGRSLAANLTLEWSSAYGTELRVVPVNHTTEPIKHCRIEVIDLQLWSTDKTKGVISDSKPKTSTVITDQVVEPKELAGDETGYPLVSVSASEFVLASCVSGFVKAAGSVPGLWMVQLEMTVPRKRDGRPAAPAKCRTNLFFSWEGERVPLLVVGRDPRP